MPTQIVWRPAGEVAAEGVAKWLKERAQSEPRQMTQSEVIQQADWIARQKASVKDFHDSIARLRMEAADFKAKLKKLDEADAVLARLAPSNERGAQLQKGERLRASYESSLDACVLGIDRKERLAAQAQRILDEWLEANPDFTKRLAEAKALRNAL